MYQCSHRPSCLPRGVHVDHKSGDAIVSVRGHRGVVNNKGPDQPAYQCSLICAFVYSLWIHSYLDLLRANFQFLGSIYITEQADLNLTLPEAPKTGFVASRPNYDGPVQ